MTIDMEDIKEGRVYLNGTATEFATLQASLTQLMASAALHAETRAASQPDWVRAKFDPDAHHVLALAIEVEKS